MEFQEEHEFVPDYDEELPIQNEVPTSVPEELEQPVLLTTRSTSKKSRRRGCPLCSQRVPDVYHHFNKHHVPWFFRPRLACSICQVAEKSFCYVRERHTLVHPNFTSLPISTWCFLMQGFLTALAFKLGCSDIFGLVSLVLTEQCLSTFHEVDSDSTFFYRAFAAGLNIPYDFSMSPPVSLLVCFHWRILSSLLVKLSPSDRVAILSERQYHPSPRTGPQPTVLSFIDTHFHLDSMMSRIRCSTFSCIEQTFSEGSDLIAAVANYAYPKSWEEMRKMMREDDSRIYFTIGVHPHCLTDELMKRVDYLLLSISACILNERCLGIGEVGLDYTSKCKCPNHFSRLQRQACTASILRNQHTFLEQLLPWAATLLDHVLVFHCRGEGAYADLRSLLVRHELTEAKIHVHCFNADLREMRQWISSFPNAVFGITAKSVEDLITREALAYLPRDRYILESDAPHLSPSHLRSGSINSPWNIPYTIHHLSNLLNLDSLIVASDTTQTARWLYGIN